jgi:NRPS condensation-like uncharacterized protein
MKKAAYDPISPWFLAAEDLGEYISIRFGHVAAGKKEPEWIFLRHADFDGIGGFVKILRQRGATINSLPQLKHPSKQSRLDVLGLLPKFLQPRQRVQWNLENEIKEKAEVPKPTKAFAWHVFDEPTTLAIKQFSKKIGVTVNSFLLDHLTKIIRPFLKNNSSMVPWMIPVNLRGGITRDRDTANFSSYVGIKIYPKETVQKIQEKIYAALDRKEHWANWQGYALGKFSTHGIRKLLIAKERAMSQWNLGCFSNLGDWDSKKEITQPECLGGWLFCPPVLRCQLIGAGCVTFQNQLSLTIQAHPELTIDKKICVTWMNNWITEIQSAIK